MSFYRQVCFTNIFSNTIIPIQGLLVFKFLSPKSKRREILTFKFRSNGLLGHITYV